MRLSVEAELILRLISYLLEYQQIRYPGQHHCQYGVIYPKFPPMHFSQPQTLARLSSATLLGYRHHTDTFHMGETRFAKYGNCRGFFQMELPSYSYFTKVDTSTKAMTSNHSLAASSNFGRSNRLFSSLRRRSRLARSSCCGRRFVNHQHLLRMGNVIRYPLPLVTLRMQLLLVGGLLPAAAAAAKKTKELCHLCNFCTSTEAVTSAACQQATILPHQHQQQCPGPRQPQALGLACTWG